MLHLVITILVLLAAEASAQAQSPEAALGDIQRSHIEANVPAANDFNSFIHRDVADYFRGAMKISNPVVEVSLLRDGPTQSGISYPKYYAWVVVKAGNDVVAEGALRLSAIDKSRFEVTNFVKKRDIRSDPQSLTAVFPAALVSGILERAAH